MSDCSGVLVIPDWEGMSEVQFLCSHHAGHRGSHTTRIEWSNDEPMTDDTENPRRTDDPAKP